MNMIGDLEVFYSFNINLKGDSFYTFPIFDMLSKLSYRWSYREHVTEL